MTVFVSILAGAALGLAVGLAIGVWRLREQRRRGSCELERLHKLYAHTTEELRRRREPATAPVASMDIETRLEAEFARHVVTESEQPLHSLANGIGRELADLATAVQGNAQLLCEVASEPELVPRRCEHLWAGVNRLRMLTEKLLTFARDARLDRHAIDVALFLENVQREIETIHGSMLSVQIATSPFLPPALAHGRSLHNAIRFIVDTLLEIEPRTYTVSIAAYADVAEDDATSVTIEICAEAEESGKPTRTPKEALELGYLAARRSLEAQSAHLAIQQVEGTSATAFITLEAELAELDAFDDEEASPETSVHEFGGVLVLERNASIRSMIATEVERCGRKILTCIDAASARVLLEATPERFELLILEDSAPHVGGLGIAKTALRRTPHVKVLVLGNIAEKAPIDAADSQLRVLRKPFGILELRTLLGTLLSPDSAPERHVPSE